MLGWALAASVAGGAEDAAQKRVLIGESTPAFTWTFGGFEASEAAGGVRLQDTGDGWGGAAVVLPQGEARDFSSLAGGRLVAELTAGEANRLDTLTIELVDQANRRGKWTLLISGGPAGGRHRVVARAPLSAPQQVIGGAPDLTRIQRVQVLGEWDSPMPLDVTLHRLAIDPSAPALPAYDGARDDAPWRAAAAEAIAKHRTSPLRVRVVDAAGKPVAGASVSIRMTRPEFAFGTAVDAASLVDQSPAGERYRQQVLELFDRATIENNLKWPAWEREWGPKYGLAVGVAAAQWLHSKGLPVRGHTLVWPGVEELPKRFKPMLAAAAGDDRIVVKLRVEVDARIASAGRLMPELIDSWDVVNEPRNDNDLLRVLPEGEDAIADWLSAARLADPGAELLINENEIVASAGGVETFRAKHLLALVDRLQAAGAPLDGVGLQCHFHAGNLASAKNAWAIFDAFAERGLRVHISEFDFDTADPMLQARFTEDFMTAAFAHPAVASFTFWGFEASRHWRPAAAMFRADGTPKPAGVVYRGLARRAWRTRIEGVATDAAGLTPATKAFRGEYAIEATLGNRTAAATAALGAKPLTVELALPAGLPLSAERAPPAP